MPRPALRRGLAVTVAALLVAGCIVAGQVLLDHGSRLAISAPPLLGTWRTRVSLLTAPAVGLGLATARWGPGLAARARWGLLTAGACVAGFAFACLLALSDGTRGLREPLTSPDEYLHDLGRVHDLTGFLSRFTADINTYGGPHPWTTHVAGHPPGLLLVFAGLREVGLAGPWPAALLCVAVGASSAGAVLVTVRAVADEQLARRCAPFLVVLPAAVWLAVSGDAVFLGVSAWGIAALAVAARRGSPALALAGGLVLGLSLLLTYGVLPLGVLALAAVAARRRWALLVPAALGVAAVIAVAAGLGFWWVDGLSETLVRYRAGAGGYRPYGYFVVADLAALAIAVGPATVAGVAALPRASRLWWLVAPTLLAVAVADLSGAAKGEVERIWLLFMPWLAVGTASLPHPRRWLAAQVTVAVVVQSALVSRW